MQDVSPTSTTSSSAPSRSPTDLHANEERAEGLPHTTLGVPPKNSLIQTHPHIADAWWAHQTSNGDWHH